ncbi:MAG: hypothetical protein F4Z61_03065 [Acidimicrobiia bacterium]|nr:hypothetical protein [Acidimicrobiia bacterium]
MRIRYRGIWRFATGGQGQHRVQHHAVARFVPDHAAVADLFRFDCRGAADQLQLLLVGQQIVTAGLTGSGRLDDDELVIGGAVVDRIEIARGKRGVY